MCGVEFFFFFSREARIDSLEQEDDYDLFFINFYGLAQGYLS